MKLSFIIPAKDEEKYVGDCIRSIKDSMKVLHCVYEILVVNDDSTDQTKTIAEIHGAFVVNVAGSKNIAQVRNVGSQWAQGDYLIFVDADSRVNTSLLWETIHAINSKSIGGGASLALWDESYIGGILCKWWNRLCFWREWFTGCYIFVRKEIFFEMKGFNMNLFLLEDIDFSNRLNKLGKTTYISNAFVLTSARKLNLFSPKEHFKFWLSLIFKFNKTIHTKSLCPIWYEIRR